MGNYRPASLTSVICKVMESIVRDEVVDHMNRNNLFSNEQHGFVPRRNCVTNLRTCIEIWTRMVDASQLYHIHRFCKGLRFCSASETPGESEEFWYNR